MRNVTFFEDTSDLSVSQIHEKISELTKKYFQAQNPEVKHQISTFIEYYKQEARIKEEKNRQETNQNGDLDLDNLINIS